MPGFELIGEEERRHVQEVLDSGVLMRYGFDGARNGQWKCRELEQRLSSRFGARYAHVCSSGTPRKPQIGWPDVTRTRSIACFT